MKKNFQAKGNFDQLHAIIATTFDAHTRLIPFDNKRKYDTFEIRYEPKDKNNLTSINNHKKSKLNNEYSPSKINSNQQPKVFFPTGFTKQSPFHKGGNQQ